MNVNDMIDTILNFDLDVVLAGLNESSHHLSQMEFISLIVIMAGAVLLCPTGLKLVRFWSVIAGIVSRMRSRNCGRSDCASGSDNRIGGRSRCGTCIGGAWCMEEADWWICDSSGTRLCCQCTFDETTGFYYLWNLCGVLVLCVHCFLLSFITLC